MFRLLTLALLLSGSPAFAAKTCVIVYSGGTNGDWQEKFWHEMAHCNGWVHPTNPLLIARYKAAHDGKAYDPPKKYLFVYPGPLDARLMSPRAAMKHCGAYGCQWFE